MTLSRFLPLALLSSLASPMLFAADCPPLCGHTAEDPDCALDAWAAAGPPRRQEQLTALRVLLGAVGQVGPGY